MRGILPTVIPVLVALACVTPLAPMPAPAEPLAARDARVHPNAARPRVVALAPSVAQMLQDAGLAHLLVGRHGFDRWSDPTLPVCGDQAGIDYEALLRVQPSHVLLQWGSRELPPRLATLAQRHGWTVQTLSLLSLEEVRQAARDLETAFSAWSLGSAARQGTRPPSAADRLEAALQPVEPSAAQAAGRVLLLSGASPPTALGPGSYHHQILVSLGGRPALTHGSAFMTLDLEDLIRFDPDTIILVTDDRAGPDATDVEAPRAALLPDRLRGLGLSAVRTGRVFAVRDPRALLPGTSLTAVAESMARALRAPGFPQPRSENRP
ncbi:MAG: ABC transporter substrate-binding protein [Phycisphaerae bacterium]|nr:ABC transporter substrate-binding protein [Phycisphaerae bacterium]